VFDVRILYIIRPPKAIRCWGAGKCVVLSYNHAWMFPQVLVCCQAGLRPVFDTRVNHSLQISLTLNNFWSRDTASTLDAYNLPTCRVSVRSAPGFLRMREGLPLRLQPESVVTLQASLGEQLQGDTFHNSLYEVRSPCAVTLRCAISNGPSRVSAVRLKL
jgi:hypothetical protein